MKTYILDTINRLRRFSESLDASTLMCNKTWIAFNDTGEKELYIFNTNGELIITSNGIGTKGRWEWIPANKSLIITIRDSVFMFHPDYVNNLIFALNLDGTNEHLFLIESQNIQNFHPKSLSQLVTYFNEEEKNRLAEERNRQIEERKQENIKRQLEEKEKKEKELRDAYLRQEQQYKYIIDEFDHRGKAFLTIFIIPLCYPFFWIFFPPSPFVKWWMIFVYIIVFTFIIYKILDFKFKRDIRNWIEQNTDKEFNKRLIEYIEKNNIAKNILD